MGFKERLKERREQLGISRNQLALHLGVTSNAISNYENGLSNPKADVLFSLFDILQCDANFLFQDEIRTTHEDEQDTTPTITPAEHTHIKKYRVCDDRGKGIVDNVLDYEYSRSLKDKGLSAEQEPVLDGQDMDVYDQPAAAGFGNYLDDATCETMQFPAAQIPRNTSFGVRIDGNSMEPKIPDGCIVFVQSCPAIEPGEIGIFSLDGKVYCKKLRVDRKKQEIWLESINPEHKPIPVSEDSYLHTFGKVLGVAEPIE